MPVVAVIGASANRRKFGNKAVRAYTHAGYTVVPINPFHETIEGIPACATIADAPRGVDLASMYVPPEVGITLLDGLAAAGIREVWLNPGAGSAALVEKAQSLGLTPIQACSIISLGLNPSDF